MKDLTLTFWPKFFWSQYTCGEASKKSILNFSRQAHTRKVPDCHALFLEIVDFLSLDFFGAEIFIYEAPSQNMT